MRFGGAIPVGTQSVEVRDPSGKLQWWQILEQAFLQLTSTEEGRAKYGDPNKGATLEQAWRAQFALAGIQQVCLLATNGRPPRRTADIPQTVRLPPPQLVETLARLFTASSTAVQTFVLLDDRNGHCVVLLGHDPSTRSFVYHDPWPGRSLLCRENNAFGVAAEPAEEGRWRITEAELGTVISAVFMFPTDWADLTGVTYKVTYAQLKTSEFWSFFNLREVGRREDPYARTTELLETGGFGNEIDLQIQLDASERIRGAVLALRRSWVM